MQNNLTFGDGGGVTSVGIISDDLTVTGSPVTTNGNISLQIANGAVQSYMLHNNIISGRTALTSGLASTDELLVSDAGIIKRMDVSVLQSYMQNNLTFGDGGGGSLWTDAGTITYLTSTTDKVSIGKSTNTGEMLEVNGNVKATNFILSSERSLKTNIRDIDNLRRFDNIPIHQFNFKEDSQRIRYGVIVDEVEKVAPELIYGNESKTVAYIDLLIAKIARLEQRVSELEERFK